MLKCKHLARQHTKLMLSLQIQTQEADRNAPKKSIALVKESRCFINIFSNVNFVFVVPRLLAGG